MDTQTKCGNITNKILNGANDVEQTVKYKQLYYGENNSNNNLITITIVKREVITNKYLTICLFIYPSIYLSIYNIYIYIYIHVKDVLYIK